MGVASKGVQRTTMLNTGLPKESNLYRQRSNYSTCLGLATTRYSSGNAVGKERVVAPLLFKRPYVSGGDKEAKSNVGLKLDKLAKRSQLEPNQIIDRELYSLATGVEMLNLAYENIKSKPGMMTPGVSCGEANETLDGIYKKKLQDLSAALKSERFAFSPSRRIQITKASGGVRPLSIESQMDKIVQESMRLVLEAIFESLFLDCSHGFRPHRSCQTALKKVSQEFQPVQ